MKKIFIDKSGKDSSSRVYEAIIIFLIVSVTFISVFTGKDIGENIAQVLIFVTPIAIGVIEFKKTKEKKDG